MEAWSSNHKHVQVTWEQGAIPGTFRPGSVRLSLEFALPREITWGAGHDMTEHPLTA